mmetsp:Transcript_13407/g.46821  ORF Transcript_13407/g.46821 Transcript_13407/m.46821 type:complete len:92 (+) Transcript_13407:304-579(+)
MVRESSASLDVDNGSAGEMGGGGSGRRGGEPPTDAVGDVADHVSEPLDAEIVSRAPAAGVVPADGCGAGGAAKSPMARLRLCCRTAGDARS